MFSSSYKIQSLINYPTNLLLQPRILQSLPFTQAGNVTRESGHSITSFRLSAFLVQYDWLIVLSLLCILPHRLRSGNHILSPLSYMCVVALKSFRTAIRHIGECSFID